MELIFGVVIVSVLISYFVYSQMVQDEYLKKIAELSEKNTNLHSRQKSEEVRLGFLSEKLAPFLENFPTDTKDLQHLGNPIDYVHFGKEGITFVEVKSGNSKLSKKQKDIKKMIENKKVKFEEYRETLKENYGSKL